MSYEEQIKPQQEDNIKNLKKLSEIRDLRAEENKWLLQQSLKVKEINSKKEGDA